MTRDEFEKYIAEKLQVYSREYQVAFAAHCALYVLPILAQGTERESAFNYWNKKDQAKYLFNVCYALTVALTTTITTTTAVAAIAAASATEATVAADTSAAYAAAAAAYAAVTFSNSASVSASAAAAAAAAISKETEDNGQEYITSVLDNMADKKPADIVRVSGNSEQWREQKDFFWQSLAAHDFAFLQPILEQLYQEGTVDKNFVRQAEKIDDATKEKGGKAIQKALGLGDVAVSQRALNAALRKTEFLEKKLKEQTQSAKEFKNVNESLLQLEQEKAVLESRLQVSQEAEKAAKEEKTEEDKEKISNKVQAALLKLEQPSAYIKDHIVLQERLAWVWVGVGVGCLIFLLVYIWCIYLPFINSGALSKETTFVMLFARASPLLVSFSFFATAVYQFNLKIKNVVSLKETQRRLTNLKQVLDIYIDLSSNELEKLNKEIEGVVWKLVNNAADAYSKNNSVEIQAGDAVQTPSGMFDDAKQQVEKAAKG